MPKPCQVCNNTQSKYRCPGCHLLYCSVACFKRHKEGTSCHGRSQQQLTPSASHPNHISQGGAAGILRNEPTAKDPRAEITREGGSTDDDEEEVHRLKPYHLAKLDESEELKYMLQDSQVRAAIELILSSPSPAEAIHHTRCRDPLFEKVVQKLLSTVGFTCPK